MLWHMLKLSLLQVMKIGEVGEVGRELAGEVPPLEDTAKTIKCNLLRHQLKYRHDSTALERIVSKFGETMLISYIHANDMADYGLVGVVAGALAVHAAGRVARVGGRVPVCHAELGRDPEQDARCERGRAALEPKSNAVLVVTREWSMQEEGKHNKAADLQLEGA